jgi:O-glycosyl hydrolase
LPEQPLFANTATDITFVFDKAPADAAFDFSKISAILFNSIVFKAFQGTITISNLKIGDKAVGAPAAQPAQIFMKPLANRSILEGSKGIDIVLDSIMVLKDGVNQNKAVSLAVTSSNTSLIPSPAQVTVENGKALLKLRPASGTGTSTLTVVASSSGVSNKSYTFDVNVIAKNSGTAGTVTVNVNQTYQTIQGIGAVPVPQDIDDMIDAGVSMVRFDIGGEYEPGLETVNDNSDPFVLDLSKVKISDRYDWKKILAANVRVIGCVWTPPVWMKDKWAIRPQVFMPSNVLSEDMYDEFAEYILGACLAFKNQFGVEMYSVNLQNEAEFNSSTNYTATCEYTKEVAAEVVKRTYPRLRAAGLSTRIHGFDQLPAQGTVLNWFQYFNSPAAGTRAMFDAFSIHAYGANAINPANLDQQNLIDYYTECQKYDPKKELWMTETSGGPTGEAGGIEEMSSQFAAYANGLSVWVPLGISTSQGMRFYVSKNFSKFVKAGAVRIGTVNSGGAAGLAFKHDVNKTYTVVVANTSANAQQVKLAGTGLPSKMYAYITSDNVNCQLLDSVTSADNYLVNLPGKSIITYYSKYEDVTANEEENFAAMEMIVYPNPSKGSVSLMLPNESFKEITVTDLAGREALRVKAKFNAPNTVNLELSDLPKGMYIISAKGNTTLRKKVVIE